MEKQFYLEQLASIIKKYDEAIELYRYDKLGNYSVYSLSQELKLAKIKDFYEYLAGVNFDLLFMNMLSNGEKIEVTNGLVHVINEYDDIIIKKPFLLVNDSLDTFFSRSQIIKDYNYKILSLKKDIEDIKNYNPLMDDWEKDKLVSECKEELEILAKQKSDLEFSKSWIKTNYFFKILLVNETILKKLGNYFKEKPVIMKDDYFTKEVSTEIFEYLRKFKIIKDGNAMSEEDYHDLLNHRKPNFNCKGALKATQYASVHKQLKNKVSKLKLDVDNWEKLLLQELGLKRETLAHHSVKKPEYQKIYEIINR